MLGGLAGETAVLGVVGVGVDGWGGAVRVCVCVYIPSEEVSMCLYR